MEYFWTAWILTRVTFTIGLVLWGLIVLGLFWLVTPRVRYGRRSTDFTRRHDDRPPLPHEDEYLGFGALAQLLPSGWRRLRLWWWNGHDRRLADEDRRRV